MSALNTRRARHPLFASFCTMDVFHYSDIATTIVDRCVLDLATKPTDSFIGLVAIDDIDVMDSSTRIYEVGRRRPTDDESDPDDGLETEDEDEGDSDVDEDAGENGLDVDGESDMDISNDEYDNIDEAKDGDLDSNEDDDGVGYTLTLVKQSQCASAAADIVSRHVPSAKLLTDVGSELSFRLPLSSVSSFEGLFREIESCICSTHNSIRSNNLNGEKYIGIESYGVSVTTLEEVFLRVAGCDCDENETYVGATDINAKVEEVSELCYRSTDSKACTIKGYGSRSTKAAKRTLCAICSSFILIFSMFFNLLGLCRAQNHCLVSNRGSPSFWEHFKALIKKRAICALRDKRTIAFQRIVPALFLFLGLLLLKLRPHRDQISVTLTTSNFNPLLRSGGGGGPIPFNLSLTVAKKVAMHLKGGWVQKQEPRTYHFPYLEQVMVDAIVVAGPQLGPSLLSMSEFLITSLNESYQSRYSAVVMNEPNVDGSLGYTVLHNSSCQHDAPTYINIMNNAILRLATQDSNMSIQTRNHPLPMTESQHTQHHDLDAFSAAIIVNIAFAFIPSSFVVPIVKFSFPEASLWCGWWYPANNLR